MCSKRHNINIDNTRPKFNDIFKRHFVRYEGGRIIEITVKELENNTFKVRVLSHQTHKGNEYENEIDDNQTYEIDPKTNLIIYIEHDWTVTELK